MLGHSLGGVVAYRLADRRPDRVLALIVEDIGAVVDSDLSFVRSWPRRMPTKKALIEALGRFGPPLAYAMRQYPDGWGFPFEAEDMVTSQRELNGDYWEEWLSSRVPALLLHGAKTPVFSWEHAKEMARRRPNTTLVQIDAGHAIHLTTRTDMQPKSSGSCRKSLTEGGFFEKQKNHPCTSGGTSNGWMMDAFEPRKRRLSKGR